MRYFLILTGRILDVVRDRADLVRDYATATPATRHDLECVLADALEDASMWSHATDWREGYVRRKKTGASLFWLGNGRIRQAVRKSEGRGNGWREIDATKAARKAGPERMVDAGERGRQMAQARTEADGARFANAYDYEMGRAEKNGVDES